MARLRDKKIEFYVDERELKTIDERAKTSNLDRSKYLRKISLQGYIVKVDFEHLNELIFEINKIGVNINQITKISNENGGIYSNDIKRMKEVLEEIWNKIDEQL